MHDWGTCYDENAIPTRSRSRKWLVGWVGLGVGLGCSKVCPSSRYVRGSGIYDKGSYKIDKNNNSQQQQRCGREAGVWCMEQKVAGSNRCKLFVRPSLKIFLSFLVVICVRSYLRRNSTYTRAHLSDYLELKKLQFSVTFKGVFKHLAKVKKKRLIRVPYERPIQAPSEYIFINSQKTRFWGYPRYDDLSQVAPN
jgi:thymidylate kinase